MKTHAYTIVRASGKLERVRIPAAFSPLEVANKFQHSLVFLHVPKGRIVLVDNPIFGISNPPAVFVSQDGRQFAVPRIPADDVDASKLIEHYVQNLALAAVFDTFQQRPTTQGRGFCLYQES